MGAARLLSHPRTALTTRLYGWLARRSMAQMATSGYTVMMEIQVRLFTTAAVRTN